MKYFYPKPVRDAMKVLRQHYQDQLDGKDSYLDECPVCPAVSYEEIGQPRCYRCPWFLETGGSCREASEVWATVKLRNGRAYIPKQTKTKWRKRRIRELTEWINKEK